MDALSRNPAKVMKISDWVCGVQAQDEDIRLLKSRTISGQAEDCYSIEDDEVCKSIGSSPKILILRGVRWRIVKIFHDNNGHPGMDGMDKLVLRNAVLLRNL